VPTDETFSRLWLSFAVEPGDEAVGGRTHLVGASKVLAELLAGESPLKNAKAISARLKHFEEAANDLAAQLGTPGGEGVRFITPKDADWPTQLGALGAREPLGLFVCGQLEIKPTLNHSISIVGTRSATTYGKHVASELAGELASRGFTIISGAAFGIDCVAHHAALAVAGQTVAVMPAWVLDDYPPSNAALLQQIRKHGFAISELPIGTHPTRPRFLQRNRLIAALSRATLVIEAPWRSGALSTARQAQSLLRLVMATPGPTTSPMSDGCNRMIREREAELVTSAEEVIELLAQAGCDLAVRSQTPRRIDSLKGFDAAVFEAIPTKGGVSARDISLKLGSPINDVQAALGRVELLGFVIRRSQKWALNRDALKLANP